MYIAQMSEILEFTNLFQIQIYVKLRKKLGI